MSTSSACTICSHSDRVAIDAALKSNKSVTGLSKKYGISPSSIGRHRLNHLGISKRSSSRSDGDVLTGAWVEMGSDGGQFYTGALKQPAVLARDWDDILRRMSLDPEHFEVVSNTVRMSQWNNGSRNEEGEFEWLWSYRGQFQLKSPEDDDQQDVEELVKWIKRKPSVSTMTLNESDGLTFLVVLSDWQIGKAREVRGGTNETVARVKSAGQDALARLKELIKSGRNIVRIVFAGCGDLVEGCNGFYAMQTFSVDLDDRKQDTVARWLLLWMIDLFVPLGIPIDVLAVPGNHGENRSNGKAHTTWTDNRDLAMFEVVSEICAQNQERYGHVTFVSDANLNEDDLTMTYELSGVEVGFAHGHQFPRGGNTQSKLENWLRGQALGFTGIANARLLIAGHLHHFMVSEATGRTVIQVPAMDGGSRWFQAMTGSSSPAGMLTVCVGVAAGPRMWRDLLIV